MSNSFWPKNMDARSYSVEERMVIKVNERMRLMEVAIEELKENKKK